MRLLSHNSEAARVVVILTMLSVLVEFLRPLWFLLRVAVTLFSEDLSRCQVVSVNWRWNVA